MDTATPSGTSTSSTPSTTTATPSAGASTTATPSQSVTPSQRPTFAQAFASDAAQSPATPSTDSESATTQPVDATTDPSAIHPSTDAQAPPPEKWPQILDNARAKAAQEAQATFDRDFGWAKQIPRESIDSMGRIAQQLNTDPVAFVERLIGELQSHPTHSQALRSQAGRLLASARGPQADPMPGPDVQIVDAQGQVTGETYSAAQLEKRDAWREQQQAVKAQQADRDRQAAQQQVAAATQRTEAKADDVMAELRDILDGDDAHFATMHQLWAQHPDWSAHRVALEVRNTVIKPSAAQKAEAKVLDDLKTKAASQGVNPAGAVVANTSRPTSFNDPRLKW